MSTESPRVIANAPIASANDYSFRSIVEHSTDLIIRLDREGRHLYVNPAAEHLTGIPLSEWLGRSWAEIPGMKPLADLVDEMMACVIEEGEERDADLNYDGPEDSYCFHTRMIPEWGTQGRVQSVLMIARDISARRDTEERLRESEERFRFLIEESRQVFFYTHDRDHRFTYVSPSVSAVLGYHADDLVGRPYDDLLVDGPASEDVHARSNRAFRNPTPDSPRTYLARVLHRNGTEVVLELVEAAVEREGRPVALQGFARDVTDRVRAEEMEAFLSEASHTLASSLDYERTLRSVARLAVPTLGDWCVIDLLEGGTVQRVAAYHARPAMQPLMETLLAYPPNPSLTTAGVSEVLRTGEPLRLSFLNAGFFDEIAQDENHRATLESLGGETALLVPLRHRGRTLGVITLVSTGSIRRYTDAYLRIAERLASRAALAIENARLHREAHEAIWARQEVLTVVSHDLRNPLSVITNAADLLRERPDDAALVAKYTEVIPAAAGQMNRLIEDLLLAARMEAGRFWVDLAPCDAGHLLSTALYLLQPRAAAARVALRLDAPEDLPTLMVDERRVLQVIQNLACNAIDLSPKESEIVLSARKEDAFLRITITDQGPGIDARDLPHLFDRFYQGGKVKKSGWGLGLSITKGIVEGHGGEIRADSVVGQGTSFTFTLPVA